MTITLAKPVSGITIIHMRKTLYAALLVLVLAFPAFGQVYSYMIPLSSDLYRDMDALYLISGSGVPSPSRPWSRSEANLILSRIDKRDLDENTLRLYEKISSELEASSPRWNFDDGFGIGAEIETNFEYYGHTNGDAFGIDDDWVYGYEERKPFLKAGLEFSVMDFFYTYADLQYTMGRYQGEGLEKFVPSVDFPSGIGAVVDKDENVTVVKRSRQYYQSHSINLPLQSKDFEFEWPKRALISIGGRNWNLMLGRDRISWGESIIGNFVLDDHVQYHDMTRLSFFTNMFKYEWTNIFFETLLHPEAGEAGKEDGIRMLIAHRLEFRPASWINLAISENVMYGAPVLNMRYLNPAFILHNLNNASMFNAIAHAELTIQPAKGLKIYGQFVLDQARAPNEGDSQADAWGLLAGLNHTSMLGRGYLSSGVEFAYTTPLLYRRQDVDFLMYQRSYTMDGYGDALKFYYIGFPYGGDAMVLKFDLCYRMPDVFEAGFTAEGMLHGEMDMFKSHNTNGNNQELANIKDDTPSGNEILESLKLSIYGKYEFPDLWRGMDMYAFAQVSFFGRDHYEKTTGCATGKEADIQWVLGFGFKI